MKEKGYILIAFLVLIVMLPAMALLMLYSKHMTETTAEIHNRTQALYMAFTAIAESQSEVKTNLDLDGNGVIGSVNRFFVNGEYRTVNNNGVIVALAAIPNIQTYQEDNLIEKRAIAVGLIYDKQAFTLTTPTGAVYIDGDSDTFNFSSLNSTLDIDGGSGPAIVLSGNLQREGLLEGLSTGTYITSELLINSTTITADESGADLTDFESLFVADEEEQSFNWDNMAQLREDLIVYTQELVENPTTVIKNQITSANVGDYNFGTIDNPAVVVVDGTCNITTPVTGYGTLVIAGTASQLELMQGGLIDWHGDVILSPDAKDSRLRFKANAGDSIIDGNLILVGADDSEALIRTQVGEGSLTVNGSMLLIADPESDSEDGEVILSDGFDMIVNGFLGILSTNDADIVTTTGSSLLVNGQLAVASTGVNTSLTLADGDQQYLYNSVYLEEAMEKFIESDVIKTVIQNNETFYTGPGFVPVSGAYAFNATEE